MEAWLKKVVRDYFLNRGCEEVPARSGVDLAFRDGRNLVGIRLISIEEGVIGSVAARMIREILFEMLREARAHFDKLYIAVPEIGIRSLPLPSEFRRSGIGLLEACEEGVRERIPALPLLRSSSTFNSFEGRIRELEERVAKLEERTSELAKLLNEISEMLRTSRIEAIRQPVTRVELEAGELPEFVKGNPWLAELSRRGTSNRG